jgi:hypothetical protein
MVLYEIYREDDGNGITFVHMLYFGIDFRLVPYMSILLTISPILVEQPLTTLSLLPDTYIYKFLPNIYRNFQFDPFLNVI